jgi:hypothetical protein
LWWSKILVLCMMLTLFYLLNLLAMGQQSAVWGSFKHRFWRSVSDLKLEYILHLQEWFLQICSWGIPVAYLFFSGQVLCYCGYDLNYLMRLQIFAYLFLFCSRSLCAGTVRLFLPLSIKLKLFMSLWMWICSFTMFLCTGLHQMKVFFVDHLFAFEIVLVHLVIMLSFHAWFGSFAVARH